MRHRGWKCSEYKKLFLSVTDYKSNTNWIDLLDLPKLQNISTTVPTKTDMCLGK